MVSTCFVVLDDRPSHPSTSPQLTHDSLKPLLQDLNMTLAFPYKSLVDTFIVAD